MKKLVAAIMVAIIAVTALSLAVSAYAMPFMKSSPPSAMPFMSWNKFPNSGPMRQGFGMFPGFRGWGDFNVSFVRLAGNISQFGSVNVNGTFDAQIRTVINGTEIKQGASATLMWTAGSLRPAYPGAKQNFTYTFYTARLDNASIASLNVTGYSFYLDGTWDVFKVTNSLTINTDSAGNVVGFNRNQNAVALGTKAYGKLTEPTGGNSYTLAIAGVDQLTGSVVAQRIASRMPNPFIINNGDSTTVTPPDLGKVVKAFNAMPGLGSYDQSMDYNFNYKIDICDLSTAAANVNA